MKIKAGFISNSSTCSFVLMGWRLKNVPLEKIAEICGVEYKDDDESWETIMEELFWQKDSIFHDYTGSCGEDAQYLGIEIAQWSDDGGWIEDVNISLLDLHKQLEGLKKIAKKLGIDPEKAGLHAGMYGC